jgi:aryl-alcohol dehydrogenase-like predicted oxidoreductase
MNYREIGNAGIRISEIGLGCWALGGLSGRGSESHGWRPVDERDAREAAAYALDHGVTHFDTAAGYGNGLSERMLGKALGKRLNTAVIGSKVGYAGGEPRAYEPAFIEAQCERSLNNLQREFIDLYYFHHTHFGSADCHVDDAVEAMSRLREKGKIRAIGLSSYSRRDLARLIPRIQPAVVQCQLNMMDWRSVAPGSPVVRACEQVNAGIIGFSPLDHGILTGKYRESPNLTFPDGDHRGHGYKFTPVYLRRAHAGLNRLRQRFGSSRESLLGVAVRFALSQSGVSGVVAGFRDRGQVRQLLTAHQCCLNGEDMAFIRKSFSKSNQHKGAESATT